MENEEGEEKKNITEACDRDNESDCENDDEIELEGLTLEVPDGPTVQNPPNGGKRAWLSVFGCFLLYVVYSFVMAVTNGIWASMKQQKIKADKVDAIKEAFDAMVNCGVGVAAVVMVFLGYRITALIGVFMVTVGLLLPSVVSDNEDGLLGFCIAGFAGTGLSFMSLTCIVVPMEYFTTKRIRAIILSRLGFILGALLVIPFLYFVMQVPEWRSVLVYAAVLLPLALIGVILIKPLKLQMADGSGSFKDKMLGVVDKKMFSKPLLYILMFIFFFENYGKPLLVANMPAVVNSMPNTDSTKTFLAMFAPPIGQLLGMLCLCIKYCCSLQLPSLRMTMFIVGSVNGVLALMSCVVAAAHQADNVFIAILIHGLMFGFCTDIFSMLLDNIIPNALGNRNVRIAEGFIGCVAGIGSLLVSPSNEAFGAKPNDKYYWTSSFYIGSASLLLSAILSWIKGWKTPGTSDNAGNAENTTEIKATETPDTSDNAGNADNTTEIKVNENSESGNNSVNDGNVIE